MSDRTDTDRITRDEVIRVADLAKLGLAEEEVERMRQQLSSILENMAILNELDTAAIPATAQVIPLRNIFRPDEVEASFPREDILANAPEVVDDSFRVTAILEEDEALRLDHPPVP